VFGWAGLLFGKTGLPRAHTQPGFVLLRFFDIEKVFPIAKTGKSL